MKEFLPFIDPRLRIGWDERAGHGVFSSQSIKKGEFVEIAPVIVVDRMTEDENLAKYVLVWNGRLGIALGWTMLYNHSNDNSCAYSSNFHDSLLGIMTLRNISEGEQLTVNYGPEWFSSRNMKKVQI